MIKLFKKLYLFKVFALTKGVEECSNSKLAENKGKEHNISHGLEETW